MYYLDTNTCIYYLNGKYESIRNKILSTPPDAIAVPSIVKAELLLGAYKSKNKETNLQKVLKFLQPFEIHPFDDSMTYTYAEIRYSTEKTGEIVGPNDLFIAAIVKHNSGILVSHNTEEFRKIKGLNLEDWAE